MVKPVMGIEATVPHEGFLLPCTAMSGGTWGLACFCLGDTFLG